MNFHSANAEDVLKLLNADPQGLSEEEARLRLAADGENALKEKKRKNAFLRFLAQFKDGMILVLLAAAGVSAGFAVYGHLTGGDDLSELAEAGIILAIVVLNALIGFLQENRAENALAALRAQTRPEAKVLRGGSQKTVPAREVVRGDIVLLEAGCAVPADMRILTAHSLKAEESALTGESAPVEKQPLPVGDDSPLADRTDMAYSGSKIVYGRGAGVVCATGMDTEIGKIAGMLDEAKEEPSPLTKQLAGTAKVLSIIVLVTAAIIFAVSFARGEGGFAETFMTAVAIAVAAIPEGLPATVTVVLALGVQKMSRKNAVVKKLAAVETLGCCEVICTDKTGTLTLNRMTVKRLYSPSGDEAVLRDIFCLCNDGAAADGGLEGDPTETALIARFFGEKGEGFGEFSRLRERVDEAPFDSVRKLMTTVNKTTDGALRAYTKGAPDELIKRCAYILDKGGVRPISDGDIAQITAQNDEMAKGALRVLAGAYREDGSTEEQGLIFAGLAGMYDPPREEVKAAVEKCRTAGMKPVMITGDHLRTAEAIARELGILTDGGLCATGAELDGMSDEYLGSNIQNYCVFARVSPEHKTRIVKAFKALNKVTAMTGDGVNDAPSLKEADIGVGMGVTGTEVAKEASDLVLADDNFATIVDAVEEGRKIYANVIKAVQFLLSANIAEALCLFIASVILGVRFLTPVMILWVNLVTDSLPALALGAERAEKDVMQKPPRKRASSLFAGDTGRDILIQGALQTALVFTAFCIGEYALPDGVMNGGVPMTMAFVCLCFIQLFHAFNLRSRTASVFQKGIFSNWLLCLSALAGCALTLAAALIPPLYPFFGTCPLSGVEWLISLSCAAAIIPLVELQKAIVRMIQRKRMGSE